MVVERAISQLSKELDHGCGDLELLATNHQLAQAAQRLRLITEFFCELLQERDREMKPLNLVPLNKLSQSRNVETSLLFKQNQGPASRKGGKDLLEADIKVQGRKLQDPSTP